MTDFSIDLTTVVSVLALGTLLFVPLAGLMLRYGVAPVITAVAELRRVWHSDPEVDERTRQLEERVRKLEAASRGDDRNLRFG